MTSGSAGPSSVALIEWQVTELLSATAANLNNERIESLADVRRVPGLVSFSSESATIKMELERFLGERVYRHPRAGHGGGRTVRRARVVRGLLCRAGGNGRAFCAADSG